MKKRVIQESDSEEDDVPLAKRAKTSPEPLVNGHIVQVKEEDGDPRLPIINPATAPSSPDDTPLASVAASIAKSRSPSVSTSVVGTSKQVSSDSSEEDRPLLQQVAPTNGKHKKKKRPPKKAESDDDEGDFNLSDEEEAKPKVKKSKHGSSGKTPKSAKDEDGIKKPKKKKVKVEVKEEENIDAGDDSEDEGGQEKWWESGLEVKGDGSIKWKTLQHNGVLFPPPYEPHGIRMKYDGKAVRLDAEAEEVATFFGAMLKTEHAENPVFCQNFFKDFLEVLSDHPPLDGTQIAVFSKCDFTPIWDWAEEERLKKKSLSKDQKKQIKEAKEALEEPFKFCLLNGDQEKVGNFRIEPPGLFRGRGKHPRTGMLKRRVQPEQITINIGEDAEVPQPPPGHRWAKIQHDNTVTWLACWNENINNAFKYVFLAAGSTLKGKSDLVKYEKARTLKKHIDAVRRDYRQKLTDKVMAERQLATALYLIDLYALRAGNEKGDDEADTFDFLGKDSIRYLNDVDVDEQVHKNLRIFKKNKEDSDLLFDRLTTTILNKYLGGYMKGLSAKVFRTYNASITMQNELEKTNANDTVADKILAYNRANRQVAILCNHQKTVSKTHGAAMEKMVDKHRALKYQRMKLRHTLFELDSSYKKKSAYRDDESDLEDEWIVAHEEKVTEQEKEKARKKFEKENEKLVAEGEQPQPRKILDERLEEIDENLERLIQERRTQKVEPKRSQTAAKIIAAIEKMDDRIKVHITQTTDKDENKTTSLGTSKLNYLDPRITYAWCKKYEVPIEKIFAKTLREKCIESYIHPKGDPGDLNEAAGSLGLPMWRQNGIFDVLYRTCG